MSPFRIILPFAIAALGVYQGLTHPGQQDVWFVLAGVAFAVGVFRVIKYRKTGSRSGSGTENQP